jgi:hypothetical protein
MNWGYRLLVVFLVFAAGMGYLMYRSMNTNYDLVETDYYGSELKYQEVIDGTKRADALSMPVAISQNSKGVVISLPSEMKDRTIDGNVWFYCAYDRKNDRKFKLNVDSSGAQLIPLEALPSGKYSVKIDWKDKTYGYYTEKVISVL